MLPGRVSSVDLLVDAHMTPTRLLRSDADTTPPELEEVEAELLLWNEQVELLPLLLTPPGRPILLLGTVAVSAGSAEVGLDGVPGAPGAGKPVRQGSLRYGKWKVNRNILK